MTSKTGISKTGVDWEKIVVEEHARTCIVTSNTIPLGDECYELKIGEDENDGNNSLCIYASSRMATQFLSGLIYIINMFTLEFERMLEKHVVHNYKLFYNSPDDDNSSMNTSNNNNMSIESRIISFFLVYTKCRENYTVDYDKLGKVFANDESVNAGVVRQELENNTRIENIQHFSEIVTNLVLTYIRTLATFKKTSLKKN
jgi:hypothetical protein